MAQVNRHIKLVNSHVPFLLILLKVFLGHLTIASDQLELDWITSPPKVVVADIDKVYRIGCRVTLNNSETSHIGLDDVTLWAEISKFPDATNLATSENQLLEVSVHRGKTEEQYDEHSLSKLFEYKPDRRDSNHYFRCIASVESSETPLDSGYGQEITIAEKIVVEYSPIGLAPFDESQRSGKQIVINAVNGKEARIKIDFDANPSPTSDQIKWHIVRGTSDLSVVLSPGETIHRMSSPLAIMNDYTYNDLTYNKCTVELIIESVRPDDGNDFFYLEVNNRYGKAEFRVALNIVDEDPTMYDYPYSDTLQSISKRTMPISSTVILSTVVVVMMLS